MKAFVIIVLGILVGFVVTVTNQYLIPGLGIAGLLAFWGAYLQYLELKPFEFRFTEADWKETEDAYFHLDIPRHSKLNPTIKVFIGSASNFQEADCEIQEIENDVFRVEARPAFSGKVVIR
jgi:hypothetical protein